MTSATAICAPPVAELRDEAVPMPRVRHDELVGEVWRRRWLVLVLMIPVVLLVAGRWEAILLFTAIGVVMLGPLWMVQWLSRRRQRAAHGSGVEVWVGHLPLSDAVRLWDLGLGAAFLFGAGAPIRVAAHPLGLVVKLRGWIAAGGRAHVTVQWSDIAAVHAGPAQRTTAWGQVALLPLTTISLDLAVRSQEPRPGQPHGRDGPGSPSRDDGGQQDVFAFATLDATGLVELVEVESSRLSDQVGLQSSSDQVGLHSSSDQGELSSSSDEVDPLRAASQIRPHRTRRSR